MGTCLLHIVQRLRLEASEFSFSKEMKRAKLEAKKIYQRPMVISLRSIKHLFEKVVRVSCLPLEIG